MRILDLDNDKAIQSIMLYLNIEEAKELLNDLESLVHKNDLNAHAHIDDKECQHEITVVIYNKENTSMLDKRSQKLIKENT